MKELLLIVLGVAVWGSRWKGLTVTCQCDNAAVVAIVNSGRSKMDRAKGITLFIGKVYSALYLVSAMLAYLSVQGKEDSPL